MIISGLLYHICTSPFRRFLNLVCFSRKLLISAGVTPFEKLELHGFRNEYSLAEFESEADFSDLSNIGIGYTTTEDEEHEIQLTADLVNFKIIYAVDGDAVYSVECQSLVELNEYLAALDFDTMIGDAEDAFINRQQEQAAPTAEIPAEEEQPAAVPSDRVDEMLRQAMLAAELSAQTGQNVFAFEEGSLQPVNAPTPAPAVEQPATLAPPKQRRGCSL